MMNDNDRFQLTARQIGDRKILHIIRLSALRKLNLGRENMRSKIKNNVLIIIGFFIFFSAWPLFGLDVILEGEIKFAPESELLLLQKAGFCVTEDGLFIITDQGAGNIKICEINGTRLESIKVIIQKGFHDYGLLEPSFVFYDKKQSRLGVLDLGKRQVLIYDRIERVQFELARQIPCLYLATDIQFVGENLLIAGYMPDEKGDPYDLYEVNADGQITFLLPSYYKYGLKSNEEYISQYQEKPDIRARGLNACLDVQGDDVYFAWSANYKIIKLNIKSRIIISFGQKPRFYVEPSSGKLLEALQKRDRQMMEKARQSMSYISKIFTTPEYVLVIFEGPFIQGNNSSFTLQMYSLDGKYIGEKAIPGQPGDRMYFDNDKKILYCVSKNPSNKNFGYILSKFRIAR
jgi:hypothetical protein